MFNGSFWIECNCDVVLRTHLNELLERYKIYETTEKAKLDTLLKNNKKLSKKSLSYLATNEKLSDDAEDFEIIKNIAKNIISTQKLISSLSEKHFRDNVISETKYLFTDDKFLNKLDDVNKHLVAFTNGVFDMHNNLFRKGIPEDYLCKNVGYDYINPNFEIRKQIIDIFNCIFDNNEVVEYLLKKLAIALDGSLQTEELDIMQGSGRNGKGLLDQLIRLTFGSYYSTIDISYFTTMTKKSNEASPEMADKNGVRLLMSTEPESEETIKVKTIKKVTGGDIINARKLYQNDFSFKPQFKLFIQTNDIPNLSKLDRAIEERINIINFPNTFVNKPTQPNEKPINISLKNTLTMLEFRQEFINYLFDIYNKYELKSLKTKLEKPKNVTDSTNNYLTENNPVKAFITEYYVITNNRKDRMQRKELFDEFNSVSPQKMTNKAFIAQVRYNGVLEVKVDGTIYFCGLKAKFNEVDNDNKCLFK
jgi:P4 family phage/plasmid primase-like protien